MTINAMPELLQYVAGKLYGDEGMEALKDAKNKFGHENVLDLYKTSMMPNSYDAESRESIRQNLRNAYLNALTQVIETLPKRGKCPLNIERGSHFILKKVEDLCRIILIITKANGTR